MLGVNSLIIIFKLKMDDVVYFYNIFHGGLNVKVYRIVNLTVITIPASYSKTTTIDIIMFLELISRACKVRIIKLTITSFHHLYWQSLIKHMLTMLAILLFQKFNNDSSFIMLQYLGSIDVIIIS